MKNISFFKKKNNKDLKLELYSLLKEFFYLRFKLYSNKFKKTHLIKMCRKNIAIVKTLIKENENK